MLASRQVCTETNAFEHQHSCMMDEHHKRTASVDGSTLRSRFCELQWLRILTAS